MKAKTWYLSGKITATAALGIFLWNIGATTVTRYLAADFPLGTLGAYNGSGFGSSPRDLADSVTTGTSLPETVSTAQTGPARDIDSWQSAIPGYSANDYWTDEDFNGNLQSISLPLNNDLYLEPNLLNTFPFTPNSGASAGMLDRGQAGMAGAGAGGGGGAAGAGPGVTGAGFNPDIGEAESVTSISLEKSGSYLGDFAIGEIGPLRQSVIEVPEGSIPQVMIATVFMSLAWAYRRTLRKEQLCS